MSQDRVLVGTVGKPHGLDGTVVVHPETDDADRFSPGREVMTESGRTLTVRSSRRVGDILMVGFAEFSDRNDAEQLRGSELTIDESDRRPLMPDEFWPDQLVGLEVRDPEGTTLGRVDGIDDSTTQHRLLITTSTGVVQVPLVSELVPRIEPERGYLVVVPIPGLFDGTDQNE